MEKPATPGAGDTLARTYSTRTESANNGNGLCDAHITLFETTSLQTSDIGVEIAVTDAAWNSIYSVNIMHGVCKDATIAPGI
jgi:hypothetical protein